MYSYLSGDSGRWIADNRATTHMTPNPEFSHCIRPPRRRENAKIYIGDGTELVVEYVGTIDFMLYSREDVRVTLENFSFIPILKANFMSLHTIKAKEGIF
ncbi:unnamed protein product, partial [Laminaria digitata]